MDTLILATRSSPLALWQAQDVATKLETAGIPTQLLPMETIGDRKLDVTLSKIGDKGVFTQELEQLLLDGTAHLAVHSAKDMPSRLPEGLEILAFTERELAMDVIVSHDPEFRFSNRPIRLGTSSTRRVATLKRHFPEVEPVSIRGNLQTRIRKMEEGQCDALLLAFAGVHRMGFGNLIREKLDLNLFTPAVGQGSLAIEVSASLPVEIKEKIYQVLNHDETRLALEAERSFLRKMDGGCSVPVFGFGNYQNGTLSLQGGIVSLDGKEEIRRHSEQNLESEDFEKARTLGSHLAEQILNSGGLPILEKIKQTLRP